MRARAVLGRRRPLDSPAREKRKEGAENPVGAARAAEAPEVAEEALAEREVEVSSPLQGVRVTRHTRGSAEETHPSFDACADVET